MGRLSPWKDAVMERLAYGDGTLAGFGRDMVFREGVPEEDKLARFENNNTKPYVVVWFGQRTEVLPDTSVCGVLGAAHMVTIVTQACAYHGFVADQAADHVSDLLMGYRPAAQGELHEQARATIRRPTDMSGVRSRYAISTSFTGLVDL